MTSRPLAGKNVLITGGTAGIGAAAVRMFAAGGAQVLMLGRDRLRGERLAAEIGLETHNDSIFAVACDLTSRADVHRAAAEVRGRCRRLDVLINNAGLMLPKRGLTREGQEKTFAAVYLGHVLLTLLLLERLQEAPEARILCVTCPPDKAEVNFGNMTLEKYSTKKAQAHAKGALLMFVQELARRLQGGTVTVNAVQPARRVKTGLRNQMSIFSRLPTRLLGVSPEKAAEVEYWLTTAPELRGLSGRYFDARREQPIGGPVSDAAACARLWESTLEMIGLQEE